VNPVTARIYVANRNDNTVTVIDEAQNVFLPPLVATQLLPGNVSGTVTPTFDALAAIWTPVLPQSNIYFQLDTTQGPWLAGAPNGTPISTGPDDISYQPFIAKSPALTPGTHVVYTFAAESRMATTQMGHATTGPVTRWPLP
jgi:DNA-binding beta-propeller fold protein YncE